MMIMTKMTAHLHSVKVRVSTISGKQIFRRKNMNMKKILSSLAVTTSLFTGFIFEGCASSGKIPTETEYEKITLQELAQNYKRDYLKSNGYEVSAMIQKDFGKIYIYDKNTNSTFKNFSTDDFLSSCPDFYERIEENREYDFYFATVKNNAILYLLNSPNDPRLYELKLIKIDGLRTTEEIKAEKQAKEDEIRQKWIEKQKADEEANRYDAKDFYFLTENFRPADYDEKDLFDAVSIADKMPWKNPDEIDWFGVSTKLYFSDVICTGQNGKYIEFRTDDNAIHKIMKISGRSGLKGSEKVRVYYRISKEPLLEWNVKAIKKRQ